jgi:NADPH-dependent curcumin reductase
MMSQRMNRQIVLADRPHGEPKESDFHLVETPVPEPSLPAGFIRESRGSRLMIAGNRESRRPDIGAGVERLLIVVSEPLGTMPHPTA